MGLPYHRRHCANGHEHGVFRATTSSGRGTKPTEASANVLGSMSPSMTGGDAVRARLRISARHEPSFGSGTIAIRPMLIRLECPRFGPAYPKNLTTALFVAIVVALVA
jgi:hypothetical protein